MPQHPEKSIDDLVQEVRSRAYPDSKDGTKHPCKTMRMLRVNNSVPIDGIYVKLNVLNRISGDFSSSDWQRNFQSNPSNFDHWGLGTVNQSQVSALSMVQKSLRLMVLGKPGSGKTTFLKSLVVECVEGQLKWNQQDYVPIFIALKDFAKASQKQLQSNQKQPQSNLSNYIYQEFCSWGLRDSLKERQVVEKIFAEGRALILLDGLDEVPEEIDEKSQELDQESVINEILNFSKTNNRIVITCRTQSQQSRWEGFTDVEIADFEKEEREEFVKKWFAVVNGNAESDQLAEQLIWQLQEPKNQQIAQLAVTPILLNLICIRFRDGDGKLPKNRADFYEDGVTILLKEWDATKPAKGVKRKTVHNSLKEIDDKKKLLAKVAAILFEQNDYFPKQEKLKELISKELDVSPSEAEKVIKSFEEQSGLLVERSKGFWSFSHLTFQEYFAAKWFCDHTQFQSLCNYMTDYRWREVFLLAVSIPSATDALLIAMKKAIDRLMLENEIIEQTIVWINQRSSSEVIFFRQVQLRGFYFDIIYHYDIDNSLIIDANCFPPLNLYIALNKKDNNRIDFILVLDHSLCWILAYIRLYAPFFFQENNGIEIGKALKKAIKSCYFLVLSNLVCIEFYETLRNLFHKLPNLDEDSKNVFIEWWKAEGESWTEQLREAMIKCRNIGHDWQFSEAQKELLRQYYDANKLLMDCLNSGCSVSDGVKAEIEETLLLPIEEIKKRQQQM